jgi:hypothetical protein
VSWRENGEIMVFMSRRVGIVGAVLLVLAAAPAVAAPAPAAPPAFDGAAVLRVPGGAVSTTVVLTQRLKLDLRIPTPATLLRATGYDDVAMVVLRAKRRFPDRPPGQIVLARIPAEAGGRVVQLATGANADSGKEVKYQEPWLAPGEYILYAVTTRATTLTVRMNDKSRRSPTLTPRQRHWSEFAVTPPLHVAGRPANASSQGHTDDLAGEENLALSILSIDIATLLGVDRTGLCAYRNGPPAGRWTPGCPTGRDGAITYTAVSLEGQRSVTAGLYYELPPGRWGVGSFYDVVGTLNSAHHYQVFLTY